MSHIKENFTLVRQGVIDAAKKANRDPREILLIAVTKNFPAEAVTEAVAAGAQYLGENRVQEMVDKYRQLGSPAEWHLIGHLQTNKVRHALPVTTWIHSLDRMSLAEEIEKRAEVLNKTVNVLIEVNVAEENSKNGVNVDEVAPLVEAVSRFPHIRVHGLMTVAPYTENPEDVRWVFRKMRELRDAVEAEAFPGVSMAHLSMGMSGDYAVAIQEGATMVRIGSAIFGNRQYD